MPDWTPLELLKTTASWLAGKGVPDARRDAEIMLCHALGLSARIELYTKFERVLGDDELRRFRELVSRRASREPVSRILGRREFMSLDFAVTPAVLSPRPETELLVETALGILRPARPSRRNPEPDAESPGEYPAPEFASGGAAEADPAYEANLHALLDAYAQGGDDENEIDEQDVLAVTVAVAAPAPTAPAPAPAPALDDGNGGRGGGRERGHWRRSPSSAATPTATAAKRVLDLGTGSGCIAIALAAFCPEARLTAVDISPEALAVAADNARARGVAERIDFRRGDWWDALAPGERFDLIVSNPPYLVPGDEGIAPEVHGHDPSLALYGGADGYDFHRRLAEGFAERLSPGGAVLVEVGAGQAATVASWFAASRPGARIGILPDGAGIDRVVMFVDADNHN